MTFFKKLRRNEDGATAIEYGLIAALIAVGIITALTNLQGGLNGAFGRVNEQLGEAENGGAENGGGEGEAPPT